MRDMLLVLDLDHLAARTVARKLRSERICCRIVPMDTSAEALKAEEAIGIVLAGGTALPEGASCAAALSLGVPVLALTSAAALLCEAMGGKAGAKVLDNSLAAVSFDDCPLLDGLETGERMIACLRALSLPDGAKSIARADEQNDAPFAFSDASGRLFGVQMDMELHDPDSTRLMTNFALNVCGCTAWWDEDAFVLRSVQEIKRVVGDGAAMCAMTGGLNSGVSALLAFKALGARFHGVFVDTGLLRENEADAFMRFYHDRMGLDITRVNAQQRFLTALECVVDPDKKKEIIGTLLEEILGAERAKIENLSAVVTGTSYSDVFLGETRQDDASLVRIEPLRDLFKDEIRQVGEYLGMPADIISSQPFPGSGLALRILGAVDADKLRVLRRADAIFREEVAASGQGKKLWQHFAVLSVLDGADDAICLRAVHASDGAPAYAARLPYDLLETVTGRILKECPEVRRVVYDMTPSGHYTGIEWQ